jgi:myo-inositol-1(or 4)-monophosphatase
MSNDVEQAVLELARQAGTIIKIDFFKKIDETWKADGTPVTSTDEQINALVLENLLHLTPTYSFIGEEGKNIIPGSTHTWICDPLDGTVAFTSGIPTCVFSLALLHNHQVIFAVIYDPFLNHLYTAKKGEGSFLNGQQIHVSDTAIIERTTVGIPFWRGEPYNSTAILEELRLRNVFVANIFSISYMSALVASGKMSAAIYTNTFRHDAAAGSLIVTEAGGAVTDLSGNQQSYDQPIHGCLLSNGKLHSEYLELVKQTHLTTEANIK